jgi:hypothetical protein
MKPILGGSQNWYKTAQSLDQIGFDDSPAEPGVDYPLDEDGVSWEPSSGCPVCGSTEFVPVKAPDGATQRVKCSVCKCTYDPYGPSTYQKKRI